MYLKKIMQALFSLFISALCLTAIIFNTNAQVMIQPSGFAVAGAEFGNPGFYPTASEMDYYQSTGLKLIRFPISWENFQPALGGTLDPNQLTKLKTVVAQAKARNLFILIDLHNYCRRTINVNGKNELVPIGTSSSTGIPVKLNHLTDFWKRMATEFKNETNIWAYGLMNEPHNMDETPISWFTMAQACITEIRKIDASTMISVAGDQWSTATGWPGVSDNLKNLVDPSKNLIYEAHCYFDDGSSQTYSSAQSQVYKKNPNRGIERVKPFVEWLHANNLRGFVGEFGVPNDPDWLIVLENFMKYLSDNCVSGTYWAAGGAWGKDYDILLEPNNGVEKPQMAILKKYKYPSGCPSTTPVGPPGYTYITDEFNTVPITNPVDVAYGANGSYVYLYNQTSTIGCNTTTFNQGDPATGTTKHCWVREAKTPYTGTPITISGIIEAENYDKGGEDRAYHDTEAANLGATYRTDGVDVGAIPAGGSFVGWTATGEWLEYSVNVTKTALYDFKFLTSSIGGGGILSLTVDGNPLLSNISVPSTGDWNTYTSFSKTAALNQGTHLIRLLITNLGFNIDKIIVTESTCSAAITSPVNSFCTGGNVLLTASTGASYKWFNGTTQVGTAATYTATTAGSYTVEVTNASGCKATSAVKVITVNPLPVIEHHINIDGTWTAVSQAAVCEGSTVTFGPWPAVSAGWSWTGPNALTSTFRELVLTTIQTNQSGSYTATYTDPNGCKASSNVTIQVSAKPIAIITSPANSFCAGESVVLTASAGTSYKWFNGTAQVGTAATYTATTAGSYTVEVTNTAGCKSTSAAKTISVTALPSATITSSTTSLCQGESVVLSASTGTSYKWFNGTVQVGTAATYTATAAGSYTVEVTNTAGCKSTSAAKIISVTPSTLWYADIDNDGKGDPSATRSSCTKPAGYVAVAGDACPTDANKTVPGNCGCNKTENSCLDCAGIPNGTAAMDACMICSGGTTGITPVTNANQCGITTGNKNTNNIQGIQVSPNPFSEQLELILPVDAHIQLIDANGQLVFEDANVHSIQTSGFANGLYLLRIITPDGISILKVIKH